MSPCRKCTAECCRYIAQQIDAPRSKEAFEHIRWFLAHKHVSVYIEKRKWYLEFKTDCKYMGPDHTCTIYAKRPQICREHKISECEYHPGAFDHEVVFTTLESFDTYLKKRFPSKKKKRIRRT
ncbi:MAG: YkgJ family cysteine cluster protein [Candidatus Omnitrophica bacterium]|nr:YkgJ family cysteine cluster protein [Candidatus Omnitrophota bacterium]